MPFNFFGKKEKAPSTQEAMQKLNDTEEMLSKKAEVLEKQIAEQLLLAKQYGTKDKRRALQALKKKKRLEANLTQVDNTLTTLEFQRDTLASARSNGEVLAAMKAGSSAIKQTHKELNVEKVDDVMDEIQEQHDIAQEINEAIARPMMGADEYDEDDLLAELEDMEQEELDAKLMDAGTEDISLPNIPTNNVPQVVKPVAKEEDDELAELEAWAS